MKKCIYLLFSLFSFNVYSQYFRLDKDGFSNDGNNYVVIEFPELKKSELFNKTLTNINSIYSSGKDVVSMVQDESINITAHQDNAIQSKFEIDYKLNLLFKDGKIRIDAPYFDMYNYASGNFSGTKVPLKLVKDGVLGFWIYNNKGKLTNQKAYDDLSNFFNILISDILKNNASNDNW